MYSTHLLFRHLSDLDKDGQLNIEEFALAMHFVELAKHGQALPPTVPPELLPPSFQSRQASTAFSPVPDGRERSDSGRERSGSERERSGSIQDGRSRSGSMTICKFQLLYIVFIAFPSQVRYAVQ